MENSDINEIIMGNKVYMDANTESNNISRRESKSLVCRFGLTGKGFPKLDWTCELVLTSINVIAFGYHCCFEISQTAQGSRYPFEDLIALWYETYSRHANF